MSPTYPGYFRNICLHTLKMDVAKCKVGVLGYRCAIFSMDFVYFQGGGIHYNN